MNEVIVPGNAMIGRTQNIREIIQTILENTLKTRPKREVYFQPFREIPGIRFEKALANQRIDLNVLYPQAKDGDVAYVDFKIRTAEDYEIYLNLRGNVTAFFEGEQVFTCWQDQPQPSADFAYDHYNVPVSVRADAENFVRIKCVKAGKDFGFSFILSIRRYPGMWANDYIYACRNNSPAPGFEGEEGFAVSALYETGKTGKEALEAELAQPVRYAFPQAPQKGGYFNFTQLCAEGDTAYVYTEAAQEQMLDVGGTIAKIFVNGKEVSGTVSLKCGDAVLFCCRKQEKQWYLDLKNEKKFTLSFLKSGRNCGDRAVWIGPFYGNKVHSPEFGIDWSAVMTNERGEKLYWRFCEGSRLRIYLDSVFYGQWFYALMVGFYGIRRAGQILADTEKQKLFCENMQFLAKYFDYITYDAECTGMPAFMPRAIDIRDLDNIGTMGMNLSDAYFDCNDKKLLPLIEKLEKYMSSRILRFEDGAFYRGDTMWADDVYMSCPFLVRLGRLTGKTQYFEEAVRQIRGFRRKLYMEDKYIFSHIYFTDVQKPNRVPWGRGNGWIFWSLSEMLLYLTPGAEFEEIKQLFCEFAAALQKLQDVSGMWRQVLDREEEGSYLETSCTAMFLLGMVRGLRMGWLDSSFRKTADAAWQALLTHSIDSDGNVYGVCMGSGRSMEAEYYYQIPTIANDDHGTGVILTAAAEYLELLQTEEI